MSLHYFLGKKGSDEFMGKLFNKLINPFLKNVTGIDYDYDFKVKSRPGTDDEYYSWILEISTDKEIPSRFEYSNEYKKQKRADGLHKRADGMHISYFKSEMIKLLKSTGLINNVNGLNIVFTNQGIPY